MAPRGQRGPRSEKRARGAESRRRASTCLARLAWLEGFPVEGGWHRLDTGETHPLDGALIARSRRAAQTVLREHREALVELVDDVERWWAIVDATLAWCSAPRGPLDLLGFAPPRLARQARALAPTAIGEAVIAAGVAWVMRPVQLAHALPWLAARDGLIDDLPTTLALARLAHHAGTPGVDALIALLREDAPDPRTALDELKRLEQRLLSRNAPPASAEIDPAPRSGVRVRAWLAPLLRREPDGQRRTLAALAAAEVVAALAPWAAWERAGADRIARARVFADRDFDRKDELLNAARIATGLTRLRDSAPPELAIELVLADLDTLATAETAAMHGPAVRLLAAMPGDPPIGRVRMLVHLARNAWPADHARPAWLWDALAAELEAGAPAGLLGPWQAVLAKDRRTYLDEELVEHLTRRAEVDRLAGVMAALAARDAVTADDAERAAAWIAAGLPAPEVLDIVVALRGVGDDGLTVELARAARALAGDDPAPGLAAHARLLLATIERLEYSERRTLMALVVHAIRGGAGWLVRAGLATQPQGLADAAASLPAVPSTRWPALVTTRGAPWPWIDRYPAALAPALRRLAAVDAEAEQIAARRLATDLPDPADLRREIAALRARPALAAGPAKRLANLERRLAAPQRPSPARLARLAGKLDQAAVTLGLARFTERAMTAAIARLGPLAADSWPGPLDRRARQILVGLARLDEPDRALATRLLRTRASAPPWDLRDDPINTAFLAEMRAAGVDPGPWLDDTATVVTLPDGRRLTLALCSDPIEVFAMGAHFETCLSPDGSNFFSVLANAADVNKRVLYARHGDTVLGRCLLAVTDGYTVLTFQPYCHDAGVGFAHLVRDFALALAARMRTLVVPHGDVRTLVARDWYDDGSRDLVGRFGALDNDALGLDQIEPGALIARLRGALAHELDDITLPLVLALPAIRSRPELLAQLAPHLLAARASSTRIAAAEHAFDAGDPALADRLLGDHARAIPLDHLWWSRTLLLGQLRPALALARLRATRDRGVRGWHDERGDRVALAAVASEALHRPRKAAELYRLAIRGVPHLADVLRAQLARLTGEPADP